jgi:penicillin-binding protein 1A
MKRLQTWLERQAGKLPPWVHRVAGHVRWPLSPLQTLIAGLAALALATVLYGNCGIRGCPDIGTLAAYQPNGAPVLLDRFGKKFGDLAPFERVVVPLDSIGEHVANAFIAVEDQRFYRHHGVDWKRVLGAALANIRHGGVAQGSSTITMQLARNVFPQDLPQRAHLPPQVERGAWRADDRAPLQQREILEMYLNHSLWRRRTASRQPLAITSASPRKGLPPRPPCSPRSPRPRLITTRATEAARARRNLVIRYGGRAHDPGTAAESRATSLRPRPSPGRARHPAAWFIDAVRTNETDSGEAPPQPLAFHHSSTRSHSARPNAS